MTHPKNAPGATAGNVEVDVEVETRIGRDGRRPKLRTTWRAFGRLRAGAGLGHSDGKKRKRASRWPETSTRREVAQRAQLLPRKPPP
jgi:hypothetical protein